MKKFWCSLFHQATWLELRIRHYTNGHVHEYLCERCGIKQRKDYRQAYSQ